MNTQKTFNLAIVFIAISAIVRQAMRFAGLIEEQYVGGASFEVIYVGHLAVGAIGLGIYLIMHITSFDFIIDKVKKLVNNNNEQG